MKKIFLLSVICASLLFSSVDINTASVKELSSLSGVGQKKAEAIIAHRDANCFKTVEEFANVKGIGQATLDKNIDKISTSKCKRK